MRLVKDSSDAGLLAPADGERLRDALELGTRPVGEVMVPLNRTVTVDLGITRRVWNGPRSPQGFSRLPVTGPDDGLLGYFHIKDALGVAEKRAKALPKSALHPVIRVEIDTPLDDTLTAMRAAGTHLAAVTGGRARSSAS